MTDTNEQKWREEFDEWRKGCSYSPMVRVAYLAARKKAQEEIDSDEIKLKKRDKLLERAESLIEYADLHGAYQWLKDYEELKK